MKRHSTLGLILSAGLLAAPLLAGVHVYVKVAPPPPPAEVRIVAPGPGYIWIGGFHRWNGTAYVWMPGRWALPPRPHAVWVAGHWKHVSHGWYWVEGRWK
jgi:WXXGXW repeat (2 copies)